MWLVMAYQAGENIAASTSTSITSPASFRVNPTGVCIQELARITTIIEAKPPIKRGIRLAQCTQGLSNSLPKR
jgi:hypothetical protein